MIETLQTHLADRYRIERELGSGGMATVWRARDTLLGRVVAMKRPHPAPPDSEVYARFERESRMAATVSHPNLVTVFDVGADEIGPFLIMEFIDAPSLAGRCCFVTDGEPVSTAELVRRIGTAPGRRVRLLAVPPALLRAGLTLLGRRDEADRLLGSLVIRPEHLLAAGWRRPYSMVQGLAETVRE